MDARVLVAVDAVDSFLAAFFGAGGFALLGSTDTAGAAAFSFALAGVLAAFLGVVLALGEAAHTSSVAAASGALASGGPAAGLAEAGALLVTAGALGLAAGHGAAALSEVAALLAHGGAGFLATHALLGAAWESAAEAATLGDFGGGLGSGFLSDRFCHLVFEDEVV